MGLFGKKKDHSEMALEEARRFDAETPEPTASQNVSGTRSITTMGAGDPALAEMVQKMFGEGLADASDMASGETVTVTTIRSIGGADARGLGALAGFGFGPNAALEVPGAGPQVPDAGFNAALRAIERDYKGKPPAEAKAAIEAALQAHNHSVPDEVVAMMANGVSAGDSIDVKFGG